MSRTLDFNRPFATQYGDGPVRHEQDGMLFLPNGQPVPVPPEIPAVRTDFIDKVLGPVSGDPEPPVAPPQRAATNDDMRLAENRALKKRWEDYGMGEWKGVEEARKLFG